LKATNNDIAIGKYQIGRSPFFKKDPAQKMNFCRLGYL